MSCFTLSPVYFLSLMWHACPLLDGSDTAPHTHIGVCVCGAAAMLFRDEWINALSPIKSNQSGGESVVLIQQESEPIREKWGCCRLMTVCLNPSVSDSVPHTLTHTQKHRPERTKYRLNKTHVHLCIFRGSILPHNTCLWYKGVYIYTITSFITVRGHTETTFMKTKLYSQICRKWIRRPWGSVPHTT